MAKAYTLPEPLVQVLHSPIAKHRHNHSSWQSLSYLHGCLNICPSGDAHQQTFLPSQPQNHRLGQFSVDLELFVRHTAVVDWRNNRCRHMLHSFEPMHRGVRLHRNEPDARIKLSQTPAGTHKCPTCAEASNKVCDPLFSLFEDL